eukprot:scaffold964_cov261-Pinguiococcus_pyrenoidosus.AAC.19
MRAPNDCAILAYEVALGFGSSAVVWSETVLARRGLVTLQSHVAALSAPVWIRWRHLASSKQQRPSKQPFTSAGGRSALSEIVSPVFESPDATLFYTSQSKDLEDDE